MGDVRGLLEVVLDRQSVREYEEVRVEEVDEERHRLADTVGLCTGDAEGLGEIELDRHWEKVDEEVKQLVKECDN